MEASLGNVSKSEEIIIEFKNNFERVRDYMKVDEELFDIVIIQLKGIESQLHNKMAENKINDIIKSLNNIRYNGTVGKKLSIIYNQSVVLMTSYFSHALEQVFTSLINEQYKYFIPKEAQKEELKITLDEFVNIDFETSERIGKMIIKKEDLKFQDMKSTQRAFDKYLNVKIPKDDNTDTIITALALRHVMVHNGGIINDQTIEQTRNAKSRKIQEQLEVGQQIEISEEEINCIGECMLQYLNVIVEQFKSNQCMGSSN